MRPVVIPSKHGDLIGFYHAPASHLAPVGDVLVVPAFAEEMNRCRSMVTLQAQAFAAIGMGTLVLDMFGTGDSAGEFDQADWEGWRKDMECGVAWLRAHGNGCQMLWGVRLGALMAAQIAAGDSSLDKLLLWMPVVNGKSYWTQFLRIRIASEMGLPNGIKTTEALRQQSAAGQVVEASGYLVGSTLAQQLDHLEMPPAVHFVGKSVAWLEVGTSAETPAPRANSKLVADWTGAGLQVTLTQVIGPQFWLVHERAVAPLLVEAGTTAVQRWALQKPDQLATTRPDPAGLGHDGRAEYPVTFLCQDAELAGVIHRGNTHSPLGVLIVVAGGPQYRVGAHRQFVSMARMFAANGYPVMRFDLRGMGDSSGAHVGYEQSGPDVRAAIDTFFRYEPQLKEVALFGECESASGILFYASQDARVHRIALANPWVRTPGVQAEAILKHYYLDRLWSREFWLSVRAGEYKFAASVRSFISVFAAFLRNRLKPRKAAREQEEFDNLPLPSRTAEGLRRFRGSVLVLLSGRDLIAREFDDVTKSSPAWQGLMADKRVTRKLIADADHTFSKPDVKAEAQRTLLDWLASDAPANKHRS